ncbi:hypothetical protein LTR16_001695 [Cryomyces antarcticus]|uniref:Magnesium chelatase n=1 Tax=Cryomyces antarcticus TaxID=329879 RepID=A0ABR0KTS0_9PEZI|nr:hypothetical protein LTR39_000443 [Cryomyces antarcticus]KAK5130155.1 hypothetical protein LTR16_001695 [Cryomyces antarcticus]
MPQAHSDALPKTKLPSFEPVHASDPADALGNRKIPNIVILRDLDWANHHVQIQTLELIRAKRIFTRTEVQAAPKRFLVIALLSKQSEKRLNPHLNDQFFISHYHAPQDGLPNSEEHEDLNDAASASSVLRTSFSDVLPELRTNPHPLFPQEFVTTLQLLTSRTLVSAPVLAYLHNITIHLRLHRFVSAPSITATATRHFRLLTRALAPLHALSYVPPSLVALAARKVYMHRVLLVRPEEERSMQWGSEIEAVREAMVGVSVEGVVEEVLGAVEVPL